MKPLFNTMILATFATSSYAETRAFSHLPPDEERVFTESEVALPDVPNPQQGDWADLYINPTFKGKPQILLSSISYAEDGSIRYILNNRSASGYNNLTAEGLLCITGDKLLGSEGSKLKTFGYADLHNNRWILPRNGKWEVIGGKHNATNSVRRVLYEAFCLDGRAKSDEELRARVQKTVGFTHPASTKHN